MAKKIIINAVTTLAYYIRALVPYFRLFETIITPNANISLDLGKPVLYPQELKSILFLATVMY